MSNRFSVSKEYKVNGIKGIINTLGNMSNKLPMENCPLLKSELVDIEKLSKALSLMASKARAEE